jgi:hypothetical protein
MNPVLRTCAAFSLAIGAVPAVCQNFVYVEPGNAACPAAPAPAASAPMQAHIGAAIAGSIRVGCGFGQGSYTVSLNSTDPDAAFVPRTFVVNFGRVVGDGSFTVTFATAGVQSVSASITSNMGSPAVPGRFASGGNAFNVVRPP